MEVEVSHIALTVVCVHSIAFSSRAESARCINSPFCERANRLIRVSRGVTLQFSASWKISIASKLIMTIFGVSTVLGTRQRFRFTSCFRRGFSAHRNPEYTNRYESVIEVVSETLEASLILVTQLLFLLGVDCAYTPLPHAARVFPRPNPKQQRLRPCMREITRRYLT
jgi:hypothetical protein